jgi:hypothetical protein
MSILTGRVRRIARGLIPQSQRLPRPGQGELPGAAQAEFVICDKSIESSYRCSGQVRGWTTSPNPVYRFLLIALSFVLLNVWVHLRWLFTQVPRRGARWLDTQRLQLDRLVRFIRRALERRYGCVQEIAAPALPRL